MVCLRFDRSRKKRARAKKKIERYEYRSHTETGGKESKFKIPLARGNKTRNSRSDARMGILIV